MSSSVKSIVSFLPRSLFLSVVALLVSSSAGFTFLSAPKAPRSATSSRNYDITGVDHSFHKAGSAVWSPINKGDQAALSVSTFQPSTGTYVLGPLQPTLSATKGVVSTTIHASTSAATSSLVRNTVKLALTIIPTSVRLFLQPLLIVYFVPLFLLRYWTGPNRKQARAQHDLFLTRNRDILDATRDFSTEKYWPAHA